MKEKKFKFYDKKSDSFLVGTKYSFKDDEQDPNATSKEEVGDEDPTLEYGGEKNIGDDDISSIFTPEEIKGLKFLASHKDELASLINTTNDSDEDETQDANEEEFQDDDFDENEFNDDEFNENEFSDEDEFQDADEEEELIDTVKKRKDSNNFKNGVGSLEKPTKTKDTGIDRENEINQNFQDEYNKRLNGGK